MKKVALFFIILVSITAVTIYSVVHYRTQKIEAEKMNQAYQAYYNVDLLGTQLISIINKTVNENEKNGIRKDEEGCFIDNGKDSIQLQIKFLYKDDYKEIPMEKIAAEGSESFIRVYGAATFRCTNIEYHQETNHVKSLTFEEIQE